MFGSLGWMEILLIFGIVMLIFGARKLPEIGRGLGKAIANFKRSVKEEPPLLEDNGEEKAKSEKTKKKKKGSS